MSSYSYLNNTSPYLDNTSLILDLIPIIPCIFSPLML